MTPSFAAFVVASSQVVPIADCPAIIVNRSATTELQRHRSLHIPPILFVELATFWLALSSTVLGVTAFWGWLMSRLLYHSGLWFWHEQIHHCWKLDDIFHVFVQWQFACWSKRET